MTPAKAHPSARTVAEWIAPATQARTNARKSVFLSAQDTEEYHFMASYNWDHFL
jgi:hypothetical protein